MERINITQDIFEKNSTASSFGENHTKATTIVLAVLLPSFFIVAIILLFCLYGYKKGSYVANCFTASRSQNDENILELEETVHSQKMDDTSIQQANSVLLNPEERTV